MQNNKIQQLNEWLDQVLSQKIPENVVAFGFNLYEDEEDSWSIELVGTSRFDTADGDWCCDEITTFGTRNNPFEWKQEDTWDTIFKEVCSYLKEYLQTGTHADTLKNKMGVGVGFVDGDMKILYTK